MAAFAYESLKIIPDRVFSIHKKAEHHHNYGKYEWKATFGDGINIGVDFFVIGITLSDFSVQKQYLLSIITYRC